MADNRSRETEMKSTRSRLPISQIIGLSLVLLAAEVNAQIYKYRDANGNMVFSDRKPAGAESEVVEEVSLPSTNAAPATETRTPAAPSKSATEAVPDYATTIISPANDSTIPMGPGNFTVSVAISPALAATERLQLLVDGSPAGAPQRSSGWELQNVYRGKHTLEVQRLDQQGKIVDRSEPVTVFVLRPSVR